jgi:hypothetical protein
MAAAKSMSVIALDRIKRETVVVEVKGTAPLIVNAWSEKAKRMIIDKQMGKKIKKELKDPEADYQASRYLDRDEGWDGFPVTGFKKATVLGGGRIFGKAIKMTEVRVNFIFMPDGIGTDGMPLVRINTPGPVSREDMVRVGMGTADIRYRAMYDEWGAELRIQYIPSLIDVGSVVSLIDAGGMNGIGEWRPEKDGTFGTFEVVGEETL